MERASWLRNLSSSAHFASALPDLLRHLLQQKSLLHAGKRVHLLRSFRKGSILAPEPCLAPLLQPLLIWNLVPPLLHCIPILRWQVEIVTVSMHHSDHSDCCLKVEVGSSLDDVPMTVYVHLCRGNRVALPVIFFINVNVDFHTGPCLVR